jgi:hypothetical protein
MMKGQQNVRCVKPGSILLEPSNLREIKEELSSWAIFKNEE